MQELDNSIKRPKVRIMAIEEVKRGASQRGSQYIQQNYSRNIPKS
jgi:hypothetical protein